MAPTSPGPLARFDRTCWIITAASGDARSGLVATFVNSASLVPSLPRLIAGIATHHRTWELIRQNGAFAAHLVDEAEIELVWRFGLQSGRSVDKFAGVAWTPGPTGSPLLGAALAAFDCRVEAEFDIGDRTIFLGEVVASGAPRPGTPLMASRVFALATPEQLRQMDADRVRDEATDAAALLAWRAARGEAPSTP